MNDSLHADVVLSFRRPGMYEVPCESVCTLGRLAAEINESPHVLL